MAATAERKIKDIGKQIRSQNRCLGEKNGRPMKKRGYE